MISKKQILWESWNAKVEEFLTPVEDVLEEIDGIDQSLDMFQGMTNILEPMQQVIHTPLGVYPIDSMLKPSDKWDCWIGHTNFPITKKILNILNNNIDGIEVLKILGKYSFFIGVAKMFNILDIRSQIDEKICSYTESEILSDEQVNETVELLKFQLNESNKHWSILVYPAGMVEYITGSDLNTDYLNQLNALLEKKKNFGGIILRSDHG